jgi:hypothetical protein
LTREDQWKVLWNQEKDTCEEYTAHRRIMDWKAYDADQEKRRKDAWHWLDDRIKALQAGKNASEKAEDTKARINYMKAVLDGYDVLHYDAPDYPNDHAWDVERVYIKERTYYVSISTDYDAQKNRKTDQLDWLRERRQRVWREAEGTVKTDAGPGWDKKHRKQRYENLCIASHYGTPWEQWQAGTYEPSEPEKPKANWRDKSADWHNAHLGITEDPPNSNSDNRKDGIRHAQDTCANGTWLRNQPWCGVWAFMGLYAAGLAKPGTHSWMASVASIEDKARAGAAPFRGWTTDGSKAKKGDLVVLFGRGVHVGTVREITSSTCRTWEGNTSSGSSGSQSNGGGSYKRDRSRSGETYGYALVRDP